MKKILALLLTLTLIVGLAACQPASAPASAPAPADSGSAPTDSGAAPANDGAVAPSGDPIKIGLPAPLSGSSGAIGKTLVNSAQLAIDQWNAKGGVHGRPVQLLSEDDENTPAKAVNVANKLVHQDAVDAIIGCLNSTACMAVQDITNKAGMIQVALGSNRNITELGHQYVFRVQANDKFQAAGLVKYVVDELGYSRLACIYVSDDFGTGGKDVVVEELANRGLELVAMETFDPDTSDVSSQLVSIKNANPDALIIWCMYQPGALICKQAEQIGLGDLPKFGGGGLVNPTLYELAGESAIGLNMVQLFYPNYDAANDAGKQFITDYQAAYNVMPDNNCGMAYDATNILLTAMQNAPETMTPSEIKAELHKLQYDGVSGDLTFTEKGDVQRDLAIVQLGEGGTYNLVYNPNA